jgi:hypothetical protein
LSVVWTRLNCPGGTATRLASARAKQHDAALCRCIDPCCATNCQLHRLGAGEPAERVEIEESKPRPHICANAPNGEERGAWAERLLSDCGCGPMNLSACLPFGECVNVARGVQGKQATSYCTSTGVRAGTACRNIAGYRNAKCKAQEAVVLRLVRDAVPNHRTGVSEGVCLGRARRM